MNTETNEKISSDYTTDDTKEEKPVNVVFRHEPVENISEFGFTSVSVGSANEDDIYKEDHKVKSFIDILQKSYEDMDQEFLNYLKNFNDNSLNQENVKSELKIKFFWCVMVFMAAIIFFPYVLVFSFRYKITDFTIIALSISSLAETLSAVIVLPKIIAKYLFNKKEEENKIKIISDMQTYNRGKREQVGDNKNEIHKV